MIGQITYIYLTLLKCEIYTILFQLYLKAISEDMPCGMFIRRRASKMIDGVLRSNLSFIREYPGVFSKAATDWLAWVETTEGGSIKHARNGGEYRVTTKIFVDGYCSDSNTIYQVCLNSKF